MRRLFRVKPRHVYCLICSKRMLYIGQSGYKKEYSLSLHDPEKRDDTHQYYVHQRCWKHIALIAMTWLSTLSKK